VFFKYTPERERALGSPSPLSNRAACVKDCGEKASDAILGAIDEIAQHKEGFAEAVRRGTHAYKQAIS
jgi:hypothetical protein